MNKEQRIRVTSNEQKIEKRSFLFRKEEQQLLVKMNK
jgi:hypothetical protein